MTALRPRNLVIHPEKNLALITLQSQRRLENQEAQQRKVLNIPKMVLENQRVLEVRMGVLMVMARSLEGVANLQQMAGALQKVQGLSALQNLKLLCSAQLIGTLD